MSKTILGKMIEKHREKHGLSRKEFAHICGFTTEQAIFSLEKGVNKTPKDHMVFLSGSGMSLKDYAKFLMQDTFRELMEKLEIEDYKLPTITFKGDIDKALKH